MNKLISDIKIIQEETLLNLKSSKAANTIRAYKSDFHDFGLFCVKNGFKTLPTDPKTVSLYLTYLATNNIKISTIKRRLVSIGIIHKIKGHYLDNKHPSIVENFMGIKRRKGIKQIGKKPLLINNLIKIINVIDKEKISELKIVRDRSIILLGFGGGFRRNELVALDKEDLDFVNEGLKIVIKRSKTDQYGEGTLKALPYFDNNKYCPVKSIINWIKISNIKTGPLFRKFYKGMKLSNNRLSDQSVALIIKKYLDKAGIDNTNYSGHSLRSGFATSAAEAGAEERSIMNMTGHKSTRNG
jgi:site-specific recombinase XerD